MIRRLLVVLALAATAAQAQEPTKAAAGTDRAVPPKGESTVASRSAPEPSTSPLSRTTGSPHENYAECPAVETMLAGDLPAVHTYEPPRPAPAMQSKESVESPPYVRAVARYGSLYIFQIWNSSQEPWILATARLEGPNGETLQVNTLLNNPGKGTRWGINIIVAEAPPGTKVPNLKIYLTAKDGRSVQLNVGDLP